jgi:hypothetical protein
MVCFVQVFLFAGCRNKKIPYTLKDVERFTREAYFDEDGNPILDLWINSAKNIKFDNGIDSEAIEKLNITGFTCSLIKDVTTGKYTGYYVEFENMGYFYGKFGSDFYMRRFSYRESPFKRMGIEQERRYANLIPLTTPGVFIMKDGLIISSYTYEAMEKNDMHARFCAYDPKNKEWVFCDTIENWLNSNGVVTMK